MYTTSVTTQLTFGTVTMHFEKNILTILCKNVKLNIKKEREKKKEQPKFSKILCRSEKGKETPFLGPNTNLLSKDMSLQFFKELQLPVSGRRQTQNLVSISKRY